MARVWNLSPGPAMPPQAVLARAAAEMLDGHGTAMSVREMSHRGPELMSIAVKAEHDVRRLLKVRQR